MKKSLWSPLESGDIVDIIAPASASPDERLEKGLEWFKDLGLVPRMQEGMIQREPFFAAPLEVQLEQLIQALHSDSKAIWCLRGGYGSMRLVPHLLKIRPPKKPKLFVGFSDITSLHLFFNQVWKWPTLHGRTLGQLNREHAHTPDRKQLEDLLFGRISEVKFTGLKPLNAKAKEVKSIKAPVTGGNLRILQSSLGTTWEVKTKGKILFMEDVSERGYSLDRIFEQLIQAKIIHKGLAAIVLGDFTQGEEKDGKDLSYVAFERLAQRVNYPVLQGLPCGHGHLNYSLPFHTESTLMTGEEGQLICPTGTK